MLQGVWGRKIGMTQIFAENAKAVPVTVIDVARWVVTQVKTKENDGYDAVQLGIIKPRYTDKSFSPDWLKKPTTYFQVVREVKLTDASVAYELGQEIDPSTVLEVGAKVNVFGTTKGKGFAGVVKRHGFSGGPASHGSNLGRAPGALSFMTKSGRVPKGKAMPGHMGNRTRMAAKLPIIKVDADAKVVLVKGSVPGGPASLVYLQKA